MIKSELIKDPCDLYIKHSVTIDLDTLEVIHQKLTNACYTEIEYRFSARRTNYTCNMVNEIRTIFSQEGISEISDLDMNCRNENYKFISIRFGKSYDYYLNIHASDSEPSDLMKELLAIIDEKNLHGYKWLTKMIVKYEKVAVMLLFVSFSSDSFISQLPDEWRNHTINFVCTAIIFSLFVLGFSSAQKMRIVFKKEEPFTLKWFLTFKDIIKGTVGSIIASLIYEYIKK